MSTLLIIDDEHAFRDFVASVATTIGYAVDAVGTAKEFRSILDERHPSVIMVDLLMPGVDGIELIRELGEREVRSKIVLASGMDSRLLETTRRLGTELGLKVEGVVEKPIRAASLRALLESLRDAAEVVTETGLRDAIEHQRLFLDYQPKIDIPTRKLIGVEALVRWRTETGRVIYPDSFIPLAERAGLINALTWNVVDRAFDQMAAWRKAGLELKVAINLSATNVDDRELPDRLSAQCNAAGVSPGNVVFELTETASMRDTAKLMEILARFRLKGFNLSIDDFGTGYSSIAQLVKLPFSELKVDRSFVSDMHRVKDSAIVTGAVIDLAHRLGLTVVAEGVENESIVAMLSDLGCEVAQGYLFSRPVAPAKIEEMATATAAAGAK